jgi:hypothetical protein
MIDHTRNLGLVRFRRIGPERGQIRRIEVDRLQTVYAPDLLYGYVRPGIDLDPVLISPFYSRPRTKPHLQRSGLKSLRAAGYATRLDTTRDTKQGGVARGEDAAARGVGVAARGDGVAMRLVSDGLHRDDDCPLLPSNPPSSPSSLPQP